MACGPPPFSPTNTPGQFFTACAVYHAASLCIKTTEQKWARLSREKHAAEYLITMQGGDKTFKWQFNSKYMQWMWVQVSHLEHLERWAEYNSSRCKCYDPIAKEWDLAWFLDYACPEPTARDGIDEIMQEEEEEEDHCPNSHSPSPLFRKGDYQLDPPAPSYYCHPS